MWKIFYFNYIFSSWIFFFNTIIILYMLRFFPCTLSKIYNKLLIRVPGTTNFSLFSFIFTFKIFLSLSSSVIVTPETVFGYVLLFLVKPFKLSNKFSSVSITSPFLSVILPPSTLYFDKKLVVDNTSLIGGSCLPSSIAFVFKFKYSIFAVSNNSDFACSFFASVDFVISPIISY